MTSCKRNRSGSALVASLFFISVLLGLLLYLVVLTRIRSDTGALDRNMRLSKQAIQSGLALALADMESSYLAPTNQVYSLPSQEQTWVSAGTGGVVSGLVEETTAEWLGWPEKLRGTAADSLLGRAQTAAWKVIGDPNEVHTVVAWVGVDLTGLLDPNSDQADIDTSSLGFSGEPNRWFFTGREFSLAHSNAVPVFVPGTDARDEGWFDPDTQLWENEVTVGAETMGEWPGDWTLAQIEDVMGLLYPDEDAAELAQSFDDFWQGREIPTDLEAVTAVAVPMVNEVSARVILENTGSTLIVSNRIEFEVWYPFPANTQTNRYRMPRTPELIRTDTGSPTTFYASTDSDEEWEFECPGGAVESAFATLRLSLSSATGTYTEGDRIELEWNLGGLELERLDGSGVVDRLPAGLVLNMPEISVPVSGAVEEVVATLEVEDPRLNHIPAHWVAATTPSMMSVNEAARLAQQQDEFRDEFACWVPQPAADLTGVDISSAQRIGHFPTGEPWSSFDLFSEEGRWWMRHTRPNTLLTGVGGLGIQNPNSRYPEAVAPVFEGRIPRKWPGQAGTAFTYEQGLELAQELEAAVLSDRGFIQRGDWNWALEAKLLELAGTKGRHGAESILAETLPHLNTRSQLWGIILLAETRGPAGQPLATTRKIFRVSRDPFENPDGARKGQILFSSELIDPAAGW